ncbi:MAG: SoxR reducing system RseC family protein [Bacteroidota bacterium]
MMDTTENITHPGIVEQLTHETVFVKILAMSSCVSCSAKGVCNVSDIEEKVVEVRKDPVREYAVGDHVTVKMKKSLGGIAVLLGYIIPFFLLIAVLILVLFISGDEGIAGLSAILILIPYYWMLYVYRNRLKRTFSFVID